MKGMLVMYDYKGKIRGIIISALGLAAMISERLFHWTVIEKLTWEQHLTLFKWVTLLGLMIIGYSKEKYEDDRAKAIRAKALQIAFMLQQSVTLAMGLTMSLHNEPIDGDILFIIAAMGTLMFLLLFHVGLYFDLFWDFDDTAREKNFFKNIGKNKWSLLVYLALAAAALLLTAIFE